MPRVRGRRMPVKLHEVDYAERPPGFYGKRHERNMMYMRWKNMNNRCYNATFKGYEDYGLRPGKKVTVCARWRDVPHNKFGFENFVDDMGPPPDDHASLDRRNPWGNYTRGNCRWATSGQQAENRRVSCKLKVAGMQLTCAEWDRAQGFPYGTVDCRKLYGWSNRDAVLTPLGAKRSRELIAHAKARGYRPPPKPKLKTRLQASQRKPRKKRPKR